MQVAPLQSSERSPREPVLTFIRNSAASAGGMVVTSLIALLLPPFLVHRLTPAVYSAWVLILNLGAYVGYFDFGVQTAVSKFVAEHDARGDYESCSRCASTGMAIMLCGMVLGMALSVGLAASVPTLFRNMPAALYPNVRLSIVAVGISLSVGLAASTFPAIFLGLQRYSVPSTINVVSRALYAGVICVAVLAHSNLAVMGMAVAAVNLVTALIQLLTWRKLASHVRVRLFPVDFAELRRMLSYCFVLTIWSVCMLFISGVDLTIVGHYAFASAAAYSIASAPTNFMLVVIGALMGPLLPATSALSTERSAEQMGSILLRTTRYMTVLLLAIGLPLLLGGYLILRLWVGPSYAHQASPILRILLLANIVRQLCAPYSTMVVATARQRVASAAAVGEAVVNLAASILLARSYGAMGVAAGTLLGSFASISMHFVVSMHYTRNLALSRLKLLGQGILRPALMSVPTVVLVRLWWIDGAPRMSPVTWAAWAGSTLLIMVLASLVPSDRRMVSQTIRTRLS
jgi:O-antigen/teichoic acid export membrane protein